MVSYLDHIVPIAQGGGRFDLWNIQIAHFECNVWKSDIEHAALFCIACRRQAPGEEGFARHWATFHEPQANRPHRAPTAFQTLARLWHGRRRQPEPYAPLTIVNGQIIEQNPLRRDQ